MKVLSHSIFDSDETLDVLYRELTKRELTKREYNKPIEEDFLWETKEGKLIPVSKMSEKHIKNIINMIETKCEMFTQKLEYEDWLWKE